MSNARSASPTTRAIIDDLIAASFLPSPQVDAIIERHVAPLERKLAEIKETFYGANLYVVGWHLNGDHESMDRFFEENDWLDEQAEMPEEGSDGQD